MKVDTAEGINRWLEQSRALSEALMKELCLLNYGYSVHVEFSVIIDAEGRVLDDPLDVGFDLDGVQRLTLEGGLTARMLERPEEIGWGLSEVALVRVAPSDDGVRFEALWEGERRIEIKCRRAILTVPGGNSAQ
jgi:hypothetical protein